MSIIFHGRGAVTDKALSCLLDKHYLGRRPAMSDVFEWWVADDVVGVLTTGCPASRSVQIGACPSSPNSVVELNRLWLDDALPKGSASWFIAQCLGKMPPGIIVSYADTAAGHDGTVYRAANFNYAGWTDMERKTPRYDYIFDGGHSRDAFRKGKGAQSRKVRRKPKAKYWIATGNRRDRRAFSKACGWPSLDWREHPVPNEHQQLKLEP